METPLAALLVTLLLLVAFGCIAVLLPGISADFVLKFLSEPRRTKEKRHKR